MWCVRLQSLPKSHSMHGTGFEKPQKCVCQEPAWCTPERNQILNLFLWRQSQQFCSTWILRMSFCISSCRKPSRCTIFLAVPVVFDAVFAPATVTAIVSTAADVAAAKIDAVASLFPVFHTEHCIDTDCSKKEKRMNWALNDWTVVTTRFLFRNSERNDSLYFS